MKSKFSSTPARLVLLACLFGFSTYYSEASCAAKVLYAKDFYAGYSYQTDYRWGDYERKNQYDPARFRATFPQSYSFSRYDKYTRQYSRNCSHGYGLYNGRLSNYSQYGFDSYGSRDFIGGTWKTYQKYERGNF